MKNITVTVPDDVYRNARIRAAERGTSVSSLVAEYLRSLPGTTWSSPGSRPSSRSSVRSNASARPPRASRPDPLTHEQATRLVESLLRFAVLDITTDLMLAAATSCQRLGVSYQAVA
jgi:hypothetical protein